MKKPKRIELEKEEVKRRMKKKERDLKIAAEKAKTGDVKVGT